MKKITPKSLLQVVLYLAFSFPLTAQGILENEHLRIELDSIGALRFFDKQKQILWGSNFPGWVYLSNEQSKEKISLEKSACKIEQRNNSISFTFQGAEGKLLQDPGFEMSGKIILLEKQIEVEISWIKSRFWLEDVEYPAHILTVKSGLEDGFIFVPHLQGVLYPSRYDAGFMRFGQNIWDKIADKEEWWAFESGNLNMPWFGASIAKSSVLITLQTSSDAVLHVIGNSVVGNKGLTVNARQGQMPGTRMSSLSPIWKSSKGELGYARRMRIELVENGYVGMAQRYKEYAIEAGRYVTLKQKIAKNPEIEKIIGAPDIKIYCYTNHLNKPYFRAWSEPVLHGYSKVNTTFSQVAEMAMDLENLGIKKCLFLLGGWNRMGYDREHIDMWPPAEAAGGSKGLANAAIAVREKGYLFALHDNYDDFYPDAPGFHEKYILKKRDGSMKKGGVWFGGPCYITCPSLREDLLNRNLALIQNSIPLNAYYFDVVTNTSHYECYDTLHPITRKEDLQYRLALLNNIERRGLVVGGERGTDWAMPVVSFCEGLSGGGNGYHRGITYRSGITVPLFYLVYRECVVGYWQHGTPHGREDHANHVLLDLLYGQPSSWSLEYDQWNDLKPMIKETYDLLGRMHEKTAHAAMIDHQFVTPDYMVQKSLLKDGTEIWVNFGLTSFKNGEFILPSKGFRLSHPGEQTISGVVSRRIEYVKKAPFCFKNSVLKYCLLL